MFMKDSTRRSKSRQDIIRSDMLKLLRRLIIADVDGELSEKIEGCFADGFVIGLSYHKHRLDKHNQNVLTNISHRVEMIKRKYLVDEEEKVVEKGM